MKNVFIRNPNIFRATLPAISDVRIQLQELPFKEMEVGSSMLSTHGFLPNPATGELVTPFPGGFAFFLRYDQKVIPPSEVKKELERRVKSHTAAGLPLTRKDKQAIKDDVVTTLATRAFTRTSVAECFYNEKDELLFVTGSAKLAQLAVAMLVRCIGSVTTTTIHVDGIKRGLTTCLQAFQAKEREQDTFSGGDDEFANLEVCGTMTLQHPETREKLSLDNIEPVNCAELDSAMERGFMITSIRLQDGSGFEFTLTDGFRLTKLKWPSVEHDKDSDAAFLWRHDAAVQVTLLTSVVERLCELLGNQQNDEAEPGI